MPALSSKQFSPTIRRMIDRNSEKIKASGGYRHWATLHNLKAMSETLNYLTENHDCDLTEFERRYVDFIARRKDAQAEFDKMAKKIAADGSIGVGERIRRHDALKNSHAKELVALNTEIAEMDRIRENTIAVHGETFYKKHSQRGAAR
jgi:hypothetical protein